MVPCIQNLIQQHNKKSFLPNDFLKIWTKELLDNSCLDGAHVKTHPQISCNLDKCKNENELKLCKWDPRLPKFLGYSNVNSQTCEQTWNVWGPALACITRHSTANRGWWLVAIFWNVRNEWIESQMKEKNTLIESGLSKFGGFLKANWNVSGTYLKRVFRVKSS